MENLLKRCSILVTDDDEDDRFLIKKALETGGLKAELHFIEDGQKLLDRLHGHLEAVEGQRNPELPGLILLDLNMPRLDGREALRLIKNDHRLRAIPVVILSNSQNPEDIAGSYKDGANSFFTKPLLYQDLLILAGILKTYWLQTAKLPCGDG